MRRAIPWGWAVLAAALFGALRASAPETRDVSEENPTTEEDEVEYAKAMAAIGDWNGSRGCVLTWPKDRMIAELRRHRREEAVARRARIGAYLADGRFAFQEFEWSRIRADADAVLREEPSNLRARELLVEVERAERTGSEAPPRGR